MVTAELVVTVVVVEVASGFNKNKNQLLLRKHKFSK